MIAFLQSGKTHSVNEPLTFYNYFWHYILEMKSRLIDFIIILPNSPVLSSDINTIICMAPRTIGLINTEDQNRKSS